MHELSIAKSIVRIVQKEVQKARAKSVEKIELDIGRLSGVELDSLQFVWKAAVQNTVLSKAERQINQIPGRGKCQNCGEVFEMHHLFDACPSCDNYINDILSGKELKVKSITII